MASGHALGSHHRLDCTLRPLLLAEPPRWGGTVAMGLVPSNIPAFSAI